MKNFLIFFNFFYFFQKHEKVYPCPYFPFSFFILTRILYIICRAQGKGYVKNRAVFDAIFQMFLTTATTSFAISRAFFCLLARGRIHFPRIIAARFPAAIGTFHFVQIRFHQFVKAFSAFRAFILQKRHFFFRSRSSIQIILPLLYFLASNLASVFALQNRLTV